MKRKLLRQTFLATLAAGALTLAATTLQAAPPGWELRNGSWVPLVQPDPNTPEGQIAAMIADLEAGRNIAKVSERAKAWLKANPTHPLVPQAFLLRADSRVQRGKYYDALFPLEDLLNNYPTSDLYNAALQREYHIADAFLNGYKRPFLGIFRLPVEADAIEILERIQDRQRGSALAERAALRIADHHFKQGEFVEAIDAYGDFLRRYPYSQYVRKAEVRRAESSLGNFRGVLFDITPLTDARERLSSIAKGYPQTAETLQVKAIDDRIYQLEGKKELEVARYYWRAGKKYASAWYYRRVIDNWPETQMAEEARRELTRRMPRELGRQP